MLTALGYFRFQVKKEFLSVTGVAFGDSLGNDGLLIIGKGKMVGVPIKGKDLPQSLKGFVDPRM